MSFARIRSTAPLAALLMAASACASAPVVVTGDPAPDSLHVRVLAIHDLHGALLPQTHRWSQGREVGGVAALKAWMDTLEARCGCPTVRLDGGDQMQGTLESNLVHGRSVVAALNHLGLDAAAVGNHELDWGPDTLLARQAEARYAWLAANVFLEGTQQRPSWARPYAIVEERGVRIGVIGYATRDTPGTLRKADTEGLEFRGGLAGIATTLAEVRTQRPDFIVVAAHADGGCGRNGCEGEMVALANQLDSAGVDLIIGGHAHFPGVGVVNGIPIVRASSHGRVIGVVDLHRLPDGTHRFAVQRDTVWTDAVTPDPAMVALVRPYAQLADSIARAPVATLRDSLFVRRGLGDLVAEAIREVAKADVGLYNDGGVRADLPAGTVTYNDVFRVLPFGNALATVRVTGRQLRQTIEHGLAGDPWFFSGISVRYDPSGPRGGRITSLSLADGRPVRDDATYALAVPDFLAAGGSGTSMLESLPAEHHGQSVLDAVIAWLKAQPQPVTYERPALVRPGR